MRADTFRFTNVFILAMLVTLTATGLLAFFTLGSGWVMQIHRAASWGLIFALPSKVFIAWRSLKRGPGKRADRNVMLVVSSLMAVIVITSIILALLWAWRIGPEVLLWYQTTLSWHWILALVLLAPLVIHVWRRWPRPKQRDFASRRGVLRGMALGGLGIAGWLAAEALAEGRTLPDSPRRVTGSRRKGEFNGNEFPVRSERAPDIDVNTWRMKVVGAIDTPVTISRADLTAMPFTEIEATLDCTDGWWTVQRWGGVAAGGNSGGGGGSAKSGGSAHHIDHGVHAGLHAA